MALFFFMYISRERGAGSEKMRKRDRINVETGRFLLLMLLFYISASLIHSIACQLNKFTMFSFVVLSQQIDFYIHGIFLLQSWDERLRTSDILIFSI